MRKNTINVLALIMAMVLLLAPAALAADLSIENAVLSIDGAAASELTSGVTGTITYTMTVTGKLEGNAAVTYYKQYMIDENGIVLPTAESIATFAPQEAQGFQTKDVTASVSVAEGFTGDTSAIKDLILVKSIANSNQIGAKLNFENNVQPTLEVVVDPEPPVIEADTTAPVFTDLPTDITTEATALNTPVELGMAKAEDNSGETVVITNNAPERGFPYGETVVTWSAKDPSGNVATAEQKVIITDKTAPVFSFIPPDITAVLSGARTAVDIGQAQATDIFGAAVSSNAPLGGFPLGTTLVTWTASDPHGNISTATQKVTVKYNFGGILQPINPDGTSIFKLGSTIPVKFQLKDTNGSYVSTAVATISYAKYASGIVGTDLEAVSTSAATAGNLFRYDTASNQYIFNMATKGLTTGSYQLSIKLDDGSTYKVIVSLK